MASSEGKPQRAAEADQQHDHPRRPATSLREDGEEHASCYQPDEPPCEPERRRREPFAGLLADVARLGLGVSLPFAHALVGIGIEAVKHIGVPGVLGVAVRPGRSPLVDEPRRRGAGDVIRPAWATWAAVGHLIFMASGPGP